MRLIRKNVEREAEGSAAEKLISDGFTPMKEATPDTVPESRAGSFKYNSIKNEDKFRRGK